MAAAIDSVPMKLNELLEQYARNLEMERDKAPLQSLDEPITATNGRRSATIGTLHQYVFDLPSPPGPWEDVPLTILPPNNLEPTEGFTLSCQGGSLWIQTFDAFGQTVPSATLVPDTSGFLQTVANRLFDMARHADSYSLGPAERLAPWLAADGTGPESGMRSPSGGAVFATNWHENLETRRSRLTALVVELVRQNKKFLVVSPSHRSADDVTIAVAKGLRGAGLTFKSLVTRYEMSVQPATSGIPLPELGFEAQMHQFYAQSRADKAALRRKYERFRELTPLLSYKAEKQRDLDEVKLLEWRLLTQLSDLQAKIKDVDTTLAEYESIPIWKRVAMQTVGRNVASLGEYRKLYEGQVQGLMQELEVAQARIAELAPEAAIPKDIRPEYEELKAEVKRLGGTKQVRELLAAEEGTNRQAFLQNKRVVVTTAARVACDPLFTRMRFDILLVDEAPVIPPAFLLAAAGLVRERIVLSGNEADLKASRVWKAGGLLAAPHPL